MPIDLGNGIQNGIPCIHLVESGTLSRLKRSQLYGKPCKQEILFGLAALGDVFRSFQFGVELAQAV